MTSKRMACILAALVLGKGDPEMMLEMIEAFAKYDEDSFMLEVVEMTRKIVEEPAAAE